jgi:hypothetical protein
MNPGEGEANSLAIMMIEPLDDEMGGQKRRSQPPRLIETLTTVRTQHQLQKERLSAAPVSLQLTC